MRTSRSQTILAIARALCNFHYLVVKDGNTGNIVDTCQVFADQGVTPHYQAYYLKILMDNKVLNREKAGHQYKYRWKESVKESFNALKFAEHYYKELHPKAKDVVVHGHVTPTVETTVKEVNPFDVFKDIDLVTELRNRGWKVICSRTKEVVTTIEETL